MNLNRWIAKGVRALLQPPAITSSFVDKKSRICSGAQVNYSRIDRFSYIGHDCFLLNAHIGPFVSIADNCRIGGAVHPIDRVSTSPVFHEGKNILHTNFAHFSMDQTKNTIIGADVWLAANVTILSGRNVGVGAVIGAGSIVTKDVPPYEVWAGNPAKKIKDRFDNKTSNALLDSEWWLWSEEKIRENAHLFLDPHLLLSEISK